MKQRTLSQEVSIEGKALHTGQDVTLTMKPAPVGHGVVFKRTDLAGAPEIKPDANLVTDVVRATTITSGNADIHTVEHVLSAIHGCAVDNVIIEMDASEPPILDGSAKGYVDLLMEGDPIEQDAEREFFELDEAVTVQHGASSMIALPHDRLKISCTSADDRGIHAQHLSIEISPDNYATQIAAARTFAVYEDIEPLIKMGKIKGGSLDCAVVLRGDKIISKEPLRFPDEFVRHKILDIVGDIMLIGKPIKAHIIATLPGHAANVDLAKALIKAGEEARKKKKKKAPPRPKTVQAHETSLDAVRILDMVPHRYPFAMIDKVVEFIGSDGLVAIKNVTYNEPYFQGHFPGNPVMPGVLQLEAMAQAAGLITMRQEANAGRTAFFMSADKVKFRRPVRPGDQIVINAKIVKTRGTRMAIAETNCTVDGQVVSSAELMFGFVDNPEA